DNQVARRDRHPDDPPNTEPPYVASGNVRITCDSSQLFADEVELWDAIHVIKARGHVTFIDGAQRITAERLEYNTKTKLGTFYQAQGIMTISGKQDPKSMLGSTEADAYFYGERVEKIGPDKYRLVHGTFTTCVQPTPRWEFEGSTVTLVKDKHAVMTNVLLRVKDVPVFYLPWFYYPINKENRATGFLMPAYGHSNLRGQTFSEAFFWAISRSQDATIKYDYGSKTGTGYGTEYRYVEAPGSQGNFTADVLNGSSGTDSILKTKTYTLRGDAVQRLPGGWQVLGNVNYANSLTAQQLLNQDINYATSATRGADFSAQGPAGKLVLSTHAYFTDYIQGDSSYRSGSAPSVHAELPSSPIGSSRVYYGIGADFNRQLSSQTTPASVTSRNQSQFSLNPNVSAPIGSLPYLNVTTTGSFSYRYYSNQVNSNGDVVAIPLHDPVGTAGVTINGPKFSRIFDTPGSGYASRWKHVLQPTFSLTKTFAFNNVDKQASTDLSSRSVAGYTATYGLENTLLAKRSVEGGAAMAETILTLKIQQTYYSNPIASIYDASYQSVGSSSGEEHVSPISLSIAATPSRVWNTQAQLLFDAKYHQMQSLSVGSGLQSRLAGVNVNWSKQFYIAERPAYANRDYLTQTLGTSVTAHTFDNRVNGSWSWNYDFTNKRQVQQRFLLAYMSQCCGVAVEYQSYNIGSYVLGATADRRFNL
ncbi:MAG TPA: putative LPS assembly protein LptD, partial [Phototrophicaceae bacterium]|nr:putative LPS assembly protein LptD [Phototrophicaceae bacterium]